MRDYRCWADRGRGPFQQVPRRLISTIMGHQVVAGTFMTLPRLSVKFDTRAEPLRKRAPLHDEHGKPLCDFMMLIPGLRDKPKHIIDATIQDVHIVLTHFSHAVVFAEFNLKLNLLWVSIRSIQGMRLEIASAIHQQVPGAKLVSHI